MPTFAPSQPPQRNNDRRAAWRLGVAAVVGGLVLALGRYYPVEHWALQLSNALRHAGVGGVLIYGLAYCVGAVFLLPAAMFSVGAGFAYGPVWGLMLAVPAAALSSLVVFLLARLALRGPVERWLCRDHRVMIIDKLLERRGPVAVVLLRLSPITPFNILNPVFGLTRIRARDYLWATSLGVIPGVLFYTQVGALATQAAAVHGGALVGGPWHLSMLVAGTLCAFGVIWWFARLSRKALALASMVGPKRLETLSPEESQQSADINVGPRGV